MPRQIPEGYDKPNKIFEYEKELFKVRRRFPRRSDKAKATVVYPGFTIG
jgi:hypothetical protein